MNSAASPGHLISKIDPVLIFDLDGTILSFNSFRIWVRHLLYGRFGGLSLPQRVLLSLRTARALLARKVLRWDHERTKRCVQRLWTDALARDREQKALRLLLQSITKAVRPNFASLLSLVSQGEADAVLATAAAGEYAYAIAEQLGFRHVIATSRWEEGVWRDNSGKEKRDRTLAYLSQHSWGDRKRVFFTDHRSDLPLIRACHLVLWFGRDAELDTVRSAAPDTNILACTGLSDAQVLALVLDCTGEATA